MAQKIQYPNFWINAIKEYEKTAPKINDGKHYDYSGLVVVTHKDTDQGTNFTYHMKINNELVPVKMYINALEMQARIYDITTETAREDAKSQSDKKNEIKKYNNYAFAFRYGKTVFTIKNKDGTQETHDFGKAHSEVIRVFNEYVEANLTKFGLEPNERLDYLPGAQKTRKNTDPKINKKKVDIPEAEWIIRIRFPTAKAADLKNKKPDEIEIDFFDASKPIKPSGLKGKSKNSGNPPYMPLRAENGSKLTLANAGDTVKVGSLITGIVDYKSPYLATTKKLTARPTIWQPIVLVRENSGIVYELPDEIYDDLAERVSEYQTSDMVENKNDGKKEETGTDILTGNVSSGFGQYDESSGIDN